MRRGVVGAFLLLLTFDFFLLLYLLLTFYCYTFTFHNFVNKIHLVRSG